MHRIPQCCSSACRTHKALAKSVRSAKSGHYPPQASTEFAHTIRCTPSTSRAFATHIDLPPTIDLDRPPPPNPASKHQTPTVPRYTRPLSSQDKQQAFSSTLEEIGSKRELVHDGQYDRVDQDEEGNFPIGEAVIPPRISQKITESPAAATPKVKAKKPRAKASTTKTPRKKKAQLDSGGAVEPIISKRWSRYQASSAEEMDFYAFRDYHRQQASLNSYTAPSTSTSTSTASSTSTFVEPHELDLGSRYDWRLRAPSQSLLQKKAYGGKIIWRKRKPIAGEADEAAYEGYRKRFQRFIDLERQAAEDQALARLKKKATTAARRSDDGFPSSVESYSDTLIGLQAKELRPFYCAKDKGKQKALPEARPTESSTADALNASLDKDAAEAEQDALPSSSEMDEIYALQQNASAHQMLSFSLPKNEDLPDHAFRKGKSIFVWKCKRRAEGGELYVPELEDASADWQQLKQLPFIATVTRAWKNRIDVTYQGQLPYSEEDYFRLDIGYDDTSFSRMEKALQEYLPLGASTQRALNTNNGKSPSTKQIDLEILGTELQDLVLRGFENAKKDKHKNKDVEKKVEMEKTQEPLPELRSQLLMQDQRIASWTYRYSRLEPIQMEGDPELGLNNTQLRAVAMAITHRLMLIQGPPGTGKTATIVAALTLLKKHFAVPFPILVCAHTNVAVDLIGEKCIDAGLKTLRFGMAHRISPKMQDRSLESQIKEHRLQYRLDLLSDQETSLQNELTDLKAGLSKKIGQNIYDLGGVYIEEALAEQEQAKKRQAAITTELKEIKLKLVKAFKTIQTDLIESSDVCLSTCISSNVWAMQTADFPMVFLDEAGQCDEPSSLVPIMKGCRHLVLIGDHKQLPSVVSSEIARVEQLNISMFERLVRTEAVPSILLDMQYRMVPSISAFSNDNFYHGSIRDSSARQSLEAAMPKPPVQFVHHESAESKAGLSIMNEGEADVIMQLVQDSLDEGRALSDIGIISAYAAQTILLRKRAAATFGEGAQDLEIATVDGFQGREKVTIILSTVRSNKTGSIGFLSDARRLNVALTRARDQLYVVGNAHTLSRINIWDHKAHVFADYVQWAMKNNFIRHWPVIPPLIDMYE